MDEKPEELTEGQEKQLEHRNRMRFQWNDLIDDLIEEGKQKGVFDNLRGKGKPLNLSQNLYAANMELANELLKNNDLKPAWVMNRQEIQEEVQALREEMQRTWVRYDREYHYLQNERQRGAVTIGWNDACKRWETQIAKLNKRIDDFNLKRPSENLELFKLDLEREIGRFGGQRWLK